MHCLKCEFENLEGMAFCGRCGTELKLTVDSELEIKCPECDATMLSTAAFCGLCGCELLCNSASSASNDSGQSASVASQAGAGAEGRARTSSGITEVNLDKQGNPAAVLKTPAGSIRAMATLPAGWFTMGSLLGVGNNDERPRHQVELSSFYIDRCKVSNLEYERFDIKHRRLRTEVSDGDDDPVVFVSHVDCLNYCRWRAEQEGLQPNTYFLPTEAQWERAASDVLSGSLYPWGDQVDSARCNSLECDRGRVIPIAEGIPNSFGLVQMGSNVREWCLDCYSAEFYRTMEAKGPNPSGPQQITFVKMNVVRGVSFQDKAADMGRCAARNYAHPDSSSNDIGFRCVRMNR